MYYCFHVHSMIHKAARTTPAYTPHSNTQCRLDILALLLCCYFAAAPRPPTGVSVEDGAGCYTSVVSWTPQPVCGVVVGNYSVRYQLRNHGGYTTVYSPGTSVTLQDLVPNAEYTVSVAAINSAGEMSAFTETVLFELQGDLWMLKCCGSQ